MPETHRCKQVKLLGLCGFLILGAGIWLFEKVYAGEVDRAVIRTKLEQMATDVAAIRVAIEKAQREKDGK